MKRPLDALRGRLARVPAAVLHRSDAAAARAAVVADVRAVFPDVPRDASSERLIRHARRVVLGAARDEFAREGVELVRLPEEWGRAELRRADIPGDAAFRSFVDEVISALEIAPSALERDDALELRDGSFSADRYGLSVEAGADLASYLLSRAWTLRALEAAEALEDGPGQRAITADTTPAPADEREFFDAQADRLREEVRDRLVRLVRVPLELRAAVDRHERLESAAARGSHGADETGEGAATSDPRSGTSRFRPGDGTGGRTRRAREDLTQKASAAFEFAQSEAGRTAFTMLRDGAEKAYGRYGRRGGADGPGRRDGQEPREP